MSHSPNAAYLPSIPHVPPENQSLQEILVLSPVLSPVLSRSYSLQEYLVVCLQSYVYERHSLLAVLVQILYVHIYLHVCIVVVAIVAIVAFAALVDIDARVALGSLDDIGAIIDLIVLLAYDCSSFFLLLWIFVVLVIL